MTDPETHAPIAADVAADHVAGNTTTSEGATAADLAAEREKLIAEANEATRLYNAAVLALDTAENGLSYAQWLANGLAADLGILPAVADAIAALPSDATLQQIETARYRATVEAKKALLVQAVAARIPTATAGVLAAVGVMQDAKRTADEVRRKAQGVAPDWLLPAMLGVGGGMWLASLLGMKKGG